MTNLLAVGTTLFAAEGPNGVHLPSDVNEAIWGSIAFFVIVGLLVRFAGKPIREAFSARTERIQNELSEAEAARAEAEGELEGVRSSVANADQEAERIVAEARTSAEALRSDLEARADQEAVEMVERARADIESSKAQTIADLRAEVARLTVGAAEAVIAHNLDQSTQTELIDNYIDQVGA
ncbi:MAG: F0F1 ATP synthase subunit B [Actinomycetota bacterium]|nr:F0F1 ATP synthase subunit B [Actinomycetota bacterium]